MPEQKLLLKSKNLKVNRFELKHYISFEEYLHIKAKLKEILKSDKYQKGGPYLVRSLYFDNYKNEAYHDKLAGVELRKKFRIRLYDFKSNKVKFEIKNKLNNQIFKESAWISKQDAKKIIEGNYKTLLKYDNPILTKIFYHFISDFYRPITVVEYDREAFCDDFNNIRITFDHDVRKNETSHDLFDESLPLKAISSGKLVIMEVKFNKFLPNHVVRILEKVSSKNSAISKYCKSRELNI